MIDLSDEEVRELKRLIPIAEQIEREAKYRESVKLVLRTWRQGVIFVGGGLAALYILRDQILILLGVR